MIINNYNYFINEKVTVNKITMEIDENLKNINAVVNDEIKNISKYYLNETADNKKIIENMSYFAIFTYNGKNINYNKKQIVCKIKVLDVINVSKYQNKSYPKYEWSYVIEATQVVGKINSEQYNKMKDEYVRNDIGIKGIEMVSDLKNIGLLNNTIVLNNNDIKKINGNIIYNENDLLNNKLPNKVSNDIENKKNNNSDKTDNIK